ncbi:MAG TPA: cytochrome c peroxidase [Longimicrobiaceae bacterium]|nr:cytochrome c peroxidase [Longimicrobiaceae bacterium]
MRPRHLPRSLAHGLGICRPRSAAGVFALILSAGAACSRAEAGDPDRASYPRYAELYTRPDSTPFPAENPYTEARAHLGKVLFFDPRLSDSNILSCGSCHNPGFSWGDGLPRGVGHGMKTLDRRTPTILNAAWAEALFWDGRASTLEEQALGPITSSAEMNMDEKRLVEKLRAIRGYQPLFEAAYPGEGISPATVGKALATYQRTIVSGTSPFDRWVSGDEGAISEEAKRGFELFNDKANCAACHSGWRFTDDSFHDIGVPGSDRGRGAVLDLDIVQFAFKTPTLRNVTERAPYMHDGSEKTLEDVIELYDLGGRVKRASLSDEIRPLRLTSDEKRALVAYMRTLSSVDAPVDIPTFPY